MSAEVAGVNKINAPAPAGKKAEKAEPEEPKPTPISPPLGGIPEPPDEDEEKERALSGYKATAEHAREPFESSEDFEARLKKLESDFEKQQKDAESETKKLMDTKRKQEEAAEAKKK